MMSYQYFLGEIWITLQNYRLLLLDLENED